MRPGNNHSFPFHIMDVAGILRLNIRRRIPGQAYADCPICGDRRGKLNLNLAKDAWRCNYCGAGGGMLALYARVYGISNSDAYREICDALAVDGFATETFREDGPPVGDLPQAASASPQEVHQTYSMLLSMLNLLPVHRKHLREVRGLTDQQIDAFQFRSTPPTALCRIYAERLRRAGCKVEGVPGFYLNDYGKWTIRFYSRTSGIIIPIVGVDGLIRGIQTRLDHPLRDKDDPPDREGIKYLTLSSAGKPGGVSSGSPIHFVGDPCARVVYVTEGPLKADIAHALTGRSFAAVLGAGNLAGLDGLFAFLGRSGTKEIIEAADMDKYRNAMVDAGSSRVAELARKYGLECRRLTWNPNCKGIDDWLLSLREKTEQGRGKPRMTWKEAYLHGQLAFADLRSETEQWRSTHGDDSGLGAALGLTEEEYKALVRGDGGLKAFLDRQRRRQRFRIYQLALERGQVVPFAFTGLEGLRKAGFAQPPPSYYRLVHEGELICPNDQSEQAILERIFTRYNDDLPADYGGHSLSPSDVVELCRAEGSRYFYRDKAGFAPVRFSPPQGETPAEAEVN